MTVNTGPMEFDERARFTQTVEGGPRYSPLAPEELSDDGAAQLASLRKAFHIPDSRPLPDVSMITLRHPGLFGAQMTLGVELAARGAIPARERELIVLRIAVLARAPFEWCEHVDIGKACGVTAEEIERIWQGSAAPGWNAHEAAMLRAVEELSADYCIADTTWNELAQSWDEKQMLELPMLVGAYLMTAMQQNSLKIQPKGDFSYR